MAPVKDQTRAIIQPIKVQPAKIFSSTIPSRLLLRLTAANIVGRKYKPIPTRPSGKPMKGAQPKVNQPYGPSLGTGTHETTPIGTTSNTLVSAGNLSFLIIFISLVEELL